MSGLKTLKKNEILFREGDNSEAMYVIKSGKIAITKAKGSSEIVLAELKAGDMLGEMAFFDSKPRSAGAKALTDTVVIELPFKALNAQFKTFPEWLKAIVRTVNTHLRNANQKIKNLEKTSEDDAVYFPPHTITRLIGILGLVASRFGEKSEEGVVVPSGTLRRYTIQIFQQPTAKMQKLMEILQAFGYMKVEDLGEGRQKITVKDPDFLLSFVDFYNDWLFKSEDKRVTIEEKELKPAKVLLFYGSRLTPDDKGEVKVNLTQMQNDSMRDLGQIFTADDINSLSEKGVVGDKMSFEGGLALKFNLAELQTTFPYWEMIYAFKKITRD
jgi:CRP/FNR family transcriptional regulator, cyclic AMP receptor protein